MKRKRYPELVAIARTLTKKICEEINIQSSRAKSDMPYKAQFVLEELIKNLEKLV
jgi:hypothetical protein